MTPEIEAQIVAWHREGLSSVQILTALNGLFKTRKTVNDVLTKHGLSQGQGRCLRFLGSCRQDAFSEITTEEQAYWLGMMITDGWVSKRYANSWVVGLQLQSSDVEHLQAFARFLGSSNPALHTKRGQSRVIVNSNRIASDLAKLGVVQRKTFETYLPTVSDEMMPHLLRGILDGDGCIAKVRGVPCRAIFYGTEKLLSDINRVLAAALNVTPKAPKQHLSIFRMEWSRREDVAKILEYLYGGATVSLPRKLALYREWLAA